MESSVFFARVLGPYFVIIALGLIFNLKNYQKVTEDFFKNSALVYLGGIMAFFFGIFIILLHKLWTAGWEVFITILGWLGVVKGAFLIILPGKAAEMANFYKKNTGLLIGHSLVILVLGIFLTVMGYFAV